MSYSALSNTSYMQPNEVTEQLIESSIKKHGVTPGGLAMMKAEAAAANESIASGLYITWSPHPSCTLLSSAYEGIKSGVSQCCRVGSTSVCLCGHRLSNHNAVKVPKTSSYIKPPGCQNCKCTGFSYAPLRPEECGQWWLPRRKDFTLKEWQERLREKPHEYACIGCEQKVSDHETIFESRESRTRRGAYVDRAYVPLSDNEFLTEQVIEGKGKVGGRVRGPALMNGPPVRTENPAALMPPDSFASTSESSAVRYK